MKYAIAGPLVLVALLAGATPALAQLSLTIHDGRVTLVADNVTVRQILTEWGRVGETKVVNADKLSGPPVTLRLENVPEQQALDILLRSSSGFMAAERAVFNPAVSVYDRILVMPPSTAVASAATGSRPTGPAAQAPMPPPVAAPVGAPPPQPAEADIVDEPPPSPYNTDGRPAETNFDYANPQEFLRRRQEMLQQQQAPAAQPSLFPGSVAPYAAPGQPGTVAPSPSQPTAPGGSARPGEIVRPPQVQPAFANPYGIPTAGSPVQPGAEPDRAKYANPYQPQPPKDE